MQPDTFLHLTATGWAAIASIVGAVSILALSVFNWFYLVAAREAAAAASEQADVAEASLKLLQTQLALTQRPFVAIHAEYCNDINACLVYAHNQGNGPALDVEAVLVYYDPDEHKSSYGIGCLAVDGKFQFLIGKQSNDVRHVTIWYKSLNNEKWTTEVITIGGSPIATNVVKGHLHNDGG